MEMSTRRWLAHRGRGCRPAPDLVHCVLGQRGVQLVGVDDLRDSDADMDRADGPHAFPEPAPLNKLAEGCGILAARTGKDVDDQTRG